MKGALAAFSERNISNSQTLLMLHDLIRPHRQRKLIAYFAFLPFDPLRRQITERIGWIVNPDWLAGAHIYKVIETNFELKALLWSRAYIHM